MIPPFRGFTRFRLFSTAALAVLAYPCAASANQGLVINPYPLQAPPAVQKVEEPEAVPQPPAEDLAAPQPMPMPAPVFEPAIQPPPPQKAGMEPMPLRPEEGMQDMAPAAEAALPMLPAPLPEAALPANQITGAPAPAAAAPDEEIHWRSARKPAQEVSLPPGLVMMRLPAAGAEELSAPAGHWEAKPGSSMKDVLAQWSGREGVELIWAAGSGFEVIESLSYDGSYEGAVEALLNQYHGLKYRPVANLHIDKQGGGRSLVIQVSQEG